MYSPNTLRFVKNVQIIIKSSKISSSKVQNFPYISYMEPFFDSNFDSEKFSSESQPAYFEWRPFPVFCTQLVLVHSSKTSYPKMGKQGLGLIKRNCSPFPLWYLGNIFLSFFPPFFQRMHSVKIWHFKCRCWLIETQSWDIIPLSHFSF